MRGDDLVEIFWSTCSIQNYFDLINFVAFGDSFSSYVWMLFTMVYLCICCTIHSLQVKFSLLILWVATEFLFWSVDAFHVVLFELHVSLSFLNISCLSCCFLQFCVVHCRFIVNFFARVSFLAVCTAAVLFCRVICSCSLLQSLLRLFCAFCGPAAVLFGIGVLADNMFLELTYICWIWFCSLNYVIYLLFWLLLLKELYEWDLYIFSYIVMYFKYLLIYLLNCQQKLPHSIFIYLF